MFRALPVHLQEALHAGCSVHRNLHAVNTHPTHVITPNSFCAEPPEDGRVTPETCRDIDC
jgi:hypothetical protein